MTRVSGLSSTIQALNVSLEGQNKVQAERVETLSSLLLQTSVQSDCYKVQAEKLTMELNEKELQIMDMKASSLEVSKECDTLKIESIKLETCLKEKNEKMQSLLQQKEDLDEIIVKTSVSCDNFKIKSKKLEDELISKNMKLQEMSDKFSNIEVS